MQLTIENFQIYKNISLKFEEGLTIITGPSNSGKSSIMRALSTLVLNPSSNLEDISYGEDRMSINLKLKNKSYTYSKSKEGTSYQIDQLSYSKIGRDNLFKLDETFPFVLDEEDNILNIQGEWNQMFPFDRKDSGLFKLFEDVFALINSTDMNKLLNSENSRLKKEIQDNQLQTLKFQNLTTKIDSLTKFNFDSLMSLNLSVIELDKLNFISIEPLKSLDLIKLDDYLEINSINYPIQTLSLSESSNLNIDLTEYIELDSLVNLDSIKLMDNINIINDNLDILSESLEVFNINPELILIESLNSKLSSLKDKLSVIDICPLCNKVM